MGYWEVKNWLDAIVETIQKQKQLVHLNSSIVTHEPHDYYFLSKGIEIIADVMGLNLDYEVDESSKFPHKYGILYRGIVFQQYEEEPLEGITYENV